MIRDTSHQDAVDRRAARPEAEAPYRASAPAPWPWPPLRPAVLELEQQRTTPSAPRLRIAEVGRGTLVRDAAVNGRVVAAVSPTLYSTAPATVTLKVKPPATP
jgi:HlyD family secretion protein